MSFAMNSSPRFFHVHLPGLRTRYPFRHYPEPRRRYRSGHPRYLNRVSLPLAGTRGRKNGSGPRADPETRPLNQVPMPALVTWHTLPRQQSRLRNIIVVEIAKGQRIRRIRIMKDVQSVGKAFAIVRLRGFPQNWFTTLRVEMKTCKEHHLIRLPAYHPAPGLARAACSWSRCYCKQWH